MKSTRDYSSNFLRRLVILAAVAVSTAAPGVVHADVPTIVGIEPHPDEWITSGAPLDSIVVTFSEPVSNVNGAVSARALSFAFNRCGLTDAAVAVNVTDSGDATSYTIQFNPPISPSDGGGPTPQRLQIFVADDVSTVDGNLNGETDNPKNPSLPTGDRAANGAQLAGGESVLEFTIITGDANRDGVTNIADQIAVSNARNACGDCTTNGGTCPNALTDMQLRADLNGDACVDAADLGIVFAGLGSELPTGNGVGPVVMDITPDCFTNSDVTEIIATFDQDIEATVDTLVVVDSAGNVVSPDSVNVTGSTATYDFTSSPLSQNESYHFSLGSGVAGDCLNLSTLTTFERANQLDDTDCDGVLNNDGLPACSPGQTVNCADNCPMDANGAEDADVQLDDDADGVGDLCDICANGNDNLDTDSDGVPNDCDMCPNDDPDDSDADGVCDSVDACPGSDDALDADNDSVPDGCDQCANGNDNLDADSDGVADACDPCPNDNPNDSDSDGVCNSNDICSGFDDALDADSDTVPDGCDQCAGGDDAVDTDNDGVADACDPCPNDNPDDANGNNICDSLDTNNPPDGGGGGTVPRPDFPFGTAIVNDGGTALVNVNSFDSAVTAIVQVSQGTPGERVTVTLFNSDDGPGIPGDETFEGFVDNDAINYAFEATTTLTNSYSALFQLIVPASFISALGLDPADLDLHVLDEEADPPTWVRAGQVFVGDSAPTNTIGQYGYEELIDGRIRYWARRDTFSVYTIGASILGPSQLPETPEEPVDVPTELPDDTGEQPVPDGTDNEQPTEETPGQDAPMEAPQCGFPCGAMGMMTVPLMMAGMMTMRRRRRF